MRNEKERKQEMLKEKLSSHLSLQHTEITPLSLTNNSNNSMIDDNHQYQPSTSLNPYSSYLQPPSSNNNNQYDFNQEEEEDDEDIESQQLLVQSPDQVLFFFYMTLFCENVVDEFDLLQPKI